jgi:biofilm PGA synthesis N-glycosyltransferase PgaC
MIDECASYALITPARNEAGNLDRLARCLAKQTVTPQRWVIVDNGSDDNTVELASQLAQHHKWIRVASFHDAGASDELGPTRAPATVRAFNVGVDDLNEPVDVVVKLDADVSFGPNYFPCLLREFASDPRLGIASGSCYERVDGVWRQRHVTAGHVWGATRAYRWRCLKDVLPLEERLCWDGIDEIKAAVRGWATRTLRDLPFYHHRWEGERETSRRAAWTTAGDGAHYMGYRFDYLVLRALHNARSDPAALSMIWGYMRSVIAREPRCADAQVRAYVRRQQSLRTLPLRMREALGKGTA